MDTEITIETVISKFWPSMLEQLSFQHKDNVTLCVRKCALAVCWPVCFCSSILPIIFMSGVLLLPASTVVNRPRCGPWHGFAWEGGQAVTAQPAKCGYGRNTVGPPSGVRRGFLEEAMSTLRSEGGVGLVSQ